MAALYLQLRANRDSTYAPVYDIVHAVKEADITYEDLSVALTRVVAGVKVSVTMNDSSTFSPNIASMEVRIGSIAEKINYYTAQAENKTKTVKFGLVRSDDGKTMGNATVMLFPSAANPLFELRITMQDGTPAHTLTEPWAAPCRPIHALHSTSSWATLSWGKHRDTSPSKSGKRPRKPSNFPWHTDTDTDATLSGCIETSFSMHPVA